MILGHPWIGGGGVVVEPNSSKSTAQQYKLDFETQRVEQMSSLGQPSSQRRTVQSFISELIFRKTMLGGITEVQGIGELQQGMVRSKQR